jgi:hypothetical protein
MARERPDNNGLMDVVQINGKKTRDCTPRPPSERNHLPPNDKADTALMKRKVTLDAHIQADAKAAFRRLRLQINQLERDRRHHRQDIDRYIPTPVRLDVLITQANAVNWNIGATSSAATTRCG